MNSNKSTMYRDGTSTNNWNKWMFVLNLGLDDDGGNEDDNRKKTDPTRSINYILWSIFS